MSDIYIRQFRPSDFPPVRDLLFEVSVTGKGSVASVVKRGFLFKAPSIVAYFLIGTGLALAWKLPAKEWISAIGVDAAALAALGCTIFVLLRIWITHAMRGFCEKVLDGDMRDIPTHYGPAAFFVAVRPTEKPHGDADLRAGEKESEEILGCVALEYLPEADASAAEIRHMLVSVDHRRNGLASRLILETIRHAETIPGVESIKLSTTEFQLGAQLLYEGFGWEAVHRVGNRIVSGTARYYRRPVRVGEYSELCARAEQGAELRRSRLVTSLRYGKRK
ncbi:hypothetical protein B0H16DRAFT_1829780 [Mycena metata]|uniref:N-acetyltransferase domain-containing protein n=1 Tax=Mycena metata TaxID=1033252 RepID=A0AAD7K960_9AGAR|nr:hypothetical protein B0H16DRAFT_1829780 [Mycena metata]